MSKEEDLKLDYKVFVIKHAGCGVVYRITGVEYYIGGYSAPNYANGLILFSNPNSDPIGYYLSDAYMWITVVDDARHGSCSSMETFKDMWDLTCDWDHSDTISKPSDDRFPHKCPTCKQPAYINFMGFVEHKGGSCQ